MSGALGQDARPQASFEVEASKNSRDDALTCAHVPFFRNTEKEAQTQWTRFPRVLLSASVVTTSIAFLAGHNTKDPARGVHVDGGRRRSRCVTLVTHMFPSPDDNAFTGETGLRVLSVRLREH